MSAPQHVLDTVAGLRAERAPLAARLDAIDLAIANISQIYGLDGAPQADTRTPVEREEAPVTRASGRPRAAAPVSLPDDLTADAKIVVAQLRKAAEPISRVDVMERTGLNITRVNKAKGILERRKLIVITGLARATRWSLPGASAKEAP